MRDNLIVKTRGDKYKAIRNENTGEKFKQFLREELRVADVNNIKITRAHRMGRGNERNNSMMIAKLPYASDQEKIYNNIAALKGTDYVLSRQLPSEIEERRQLAWKTYKQAKSDGQKASFDSAGHLYINNEHISKFDAAPIPPVSAAVAAAGAVQLPSGKSNIEYVNDHAFQAIIYKVKDMDEVAEARDILHSVPEVVAGATHIPYALRLGATTENFDSDHDHYAGSHILAVMRKLKIVDAVVFILHFDPPTSITSTDKRDCIEKIVKSAISNLI